MGAAHDCRELRVLDAVSKNTSLNLPPRESLGSEI